MNFVRLDYIIQMINIRKHIQEIKKVIYRIIYNEKNTKTIYEYNIYSSYGRIE